MGMGVLLSQAAHHPPLYPHLLNTKIDPGRKSWDALGYRTRHGFTAHRYATALGNVAACASTCGRTWAMNASLSSAVST
jgi:hypothetical protein